MSMLSGAIREEVIEPIAKQECSIDDPDFLVCDYAGGNIDDAYDIGFTHGEVSLARRIVKLLDS